jgi:hypothetical protein
MKKLFFVVVALAMFVTSTFYGCKKETDNPISNPKTDTIGFDLTVDEVMKNCRYDPNHANYRSSNIATPIPREFNPLWTFSWESERNGKKVVIVPFSGINDSDINSISRDAFLLVYKNDSNQIDYKIQGYSRDNTKNNSDFNKFYGKVILINSDFTVNNITDVEDGVIQGRRSGPGGKCYSFGESAWDKFLNFLADIIGGFGGNGGGNGGMNNGGGWDGSGNGGGNGGSNGGGNGGGDYGGGSGYGTGGSATTATGSGSIPDFKDFYMNTLTKSVYSTMTTLYKINPNITFSDFSKEMDVLISNYPPDVQKCLKDNYSELYKYFSSGPDKPFWFFESNTNNTTSCLKTAISNNVKLMATAYPESTIFLAPEYPIKYLDIYNCLQFDASNVNAKYNIYLHIDQPINGSSSSISPIGMSAGHVYITLEEESGGKIYSKTFGFYPSCTGAYQVLGCVGTLGDDSKSRADITVAWKNIGKDRYFGALLAAKNLGTSSYYITPPPDITSGNNCFDFALNVLKAADIDLWTGIKQIGMKQNPGKLGEYIKSIKDN